MRKVLTTIGIAAILLLIVAVSSPAAAALNVCRDTPSGPQGEGVDIPISLEVTVDTATWYMVDEFIPAGLTVTDAGGADTTEAGHLKWIVLTGATATTCTYTVQGSAGTYTFAGEFQIEGMPDSAPIDCDTELVIDGEPPEGQNVCRDTPSGPQGEGVDIPISLEVTVDTATWYMVDEFIPAGLTVTDAGGADTTEAGHLKWIVLTGATATTCTYTVQGSAGTYTFAGEFQIEGMPDSAPIDCDTELEISPNDHPTVTVTYPVSGTVNGPIAVTATATDTDGTVTQVAFYLMPAETLIGTDADSTGGWSVPLDTTTVDNGNYQIKAVATDDEGATAENTGSEFTIDNGFCLTLDAGWNMVSIPKKINSSSSNAAPDVFNLVGGETCDYYNGCTVEWSSNWGVNVVPCRGYLVYKLAPETICVDLDTGNSVPPSQYLCAGWNLVGHIDTSDRSVEEFASMTTLGDNIAQMWHRTSGGMWTGYPYWTLDTVTPGDGYWLLMSEDGMMYGTP